VTDEEQRILYRLDGKFEAMAERVEKIENKVDRIDTTLATASGGWRMLVVVGGLAGSIGSALTYLASYLHLPKP
jgi:hypothetical protein